MTQKDLATALLLSVFLPGGGQVYFGDYTTAALVWLGDLLATGLLVFSLNSPSPKSSVGVTVGICLLVGLWIFSILDAYFRKRAQRPNVAGETSEPVGSEAAAPGGSPSAPRKHGNVSGATLAIAIIGLVVVAGGVYAFTIASKSGFGGAPDLVNKSCSASPVEGQGVAWGKVVDFQNKPVSEATVTASDPYFSKQTLVTASTDGRGCYAMTVEFGFCYKFQASKPDYPTEYPLTTGFNCVTFNKGEAKQLNFKLEY